MTLQRCRKETALGNGGGSMAAKTRVLLIDDHPVVRTGCRALLGRRPNLKLLEAGGGADGLRLNLSQQPAIVILDLGLNDVGGFDILKRLGEDNPSCRVLIFTMYEDAVSAARALEAGAKGYVTKTDGPSVLLDAVDTLLAGKSYLSHAIAQKLALMRLRAGDNPLRALTSREIDVMRLLGSGKSAAEIAGDLNLSYRTVANVISLIKRKLHVRTAAGLCRLAVECTGAQRDIGLPVSGLPIAR
jgi:DNA-binding NarL/FixJ family response regulator